MKKLMLTLLMLVFVALPVLAGFHAAGGFDRVKTYGGTGSDLGYQVAVASNGDIVLAGTFSNTVNFGGGAFTSAGSDDIVVARFTSAGVHIWSKQYGGTSSDAAVGLALASNGDVVVCGNYSGTTNFGGGARTSAGGTDIFVVKLSAADGAYQWDKALGAANGDAANAVAIDSGGNVIVTGIFRDTVNFGGGDLTSALLGAPDMFIAKYDTDGVFVWANNFEGTSTDYGSSVAVDSLDNIIAVGGFLGTINFGGSDLVFHGTTNEDFFVVKFDDDGSHIWSTSFGANGTDGAADVAIDSSNNIFITGQFALTVSFGGVSRTAVGQDVYVLKLDSAGATLWARNYFSTGNKAGVAIAVDSVGDVLVTGSFDGTLNFGGSLLTTAGFTDIFVAKLTGAFGNYVWSHRYGSTLTEQGLDVTTVGEKAIFSGYFKGTVNFGGGNVTGNGTSSDIFILHLWNTGMVSAGGSGQKPKYVIQPPE